MGKGVQVMWGLGMASEFMHRGRNWVLEVQGKGEWVQGIMKKRTGERKRCDRSHTTRAI